MGAALHFTGSWDSRGVDKVEFLAEGSYNDIYVVTFKPCNDEASLPRRVVLRVPQEQEYKTVPYRLRNMSGCSAWLRKHHPEIPVPHVHAICYGIPGCKAFLAEDYIEGSALSDCWLKYSNAEKEAVAKKLAKLIADMAGFRFDQIGGFACDNEEVLGPTVEGHKISKGRDKFHDRRYYDIGPYDTNRDYVVSQYDKEIAYYTQAPASDIDQDLFQEVSVSDFVKTLESDRHAVAHFNPPLGSDTPSTPDYANVPPKRHSALCPNADSNDRIKYLALDPSEPNVLHHGDLQGRNIIMLDDCPTDIAGIIDWEFAGAYPLSELLPMGQGPDVLEMVDDETTEECSEWSERIAGIVCEEVMEKGWDEEEVEWLCEGSGGVLAEARKEMVPRH